MVISAEGNKETGKLEEYDERIRRVVQREDLMLEIKDEI